MTSRRTALVACLLGLCAVACLLFACLIGSVPIAPSELPQALVEILRGAPGSLSATLLELRLSRALMAFVTGASLALAGVMMQALLRNPLADPYILGISSGASVGALAALLFMWELWGIDCAALAGAVVISVVLYLLARRDLSGDETAQGGSSLLLLTGVILASACMALVTLMLSVAPDSRLRGMVFWMIGDLSGVPLRWTPWAVLAAVLALSLRGARSINMMALHAEGAATLGVRVGAVRKWLFCGSAALTAAAVTTAGSIGFVGLIIPHAIRFAFGPDHRLLIPASALAGGAFLVLADTLARTMVAPQQMPVGVLTAMIGAPVFLYQLHQLRRK